MSAEVPPLGEVIQVTWPEQSRAEGLPENALDAEILYLNPEHRLPEMQQLAAQKTRAEADPTPLATVTELPPRTPIAAVRPQEATVSYIRPELAPPAQGEITTTERLLTYCRDMYSHYMHTYETSAGITDDETVRPQVAQARSDANQVAAAAAAMQNEHDAKKAVTTFMDGDATSRRLASVLVSRYLHKGFLTDKEAIDYWNQLAADDASIVSNNVAKQVRLEIQRRQASEYAHTDLGRQRITVVKRALDGLLATQPSRDI